MKIALRFLAAVIGAVAGAIFGSVLGVFAATLYGGDNDLGVAFAIMFIGPSGIIVGAIAGLLSGLFLLRHFAKIGLRRRIVTILALFFLMLGSVAGMLWAIQDRNVPPSDQKLITHFEKHEATFNRLVEMLKQDSQLTRVDTDWTRPSDPATIGVSPERIGTYRQMLREARVPRGFETSATPKEIDFLYWGIGSAVSSDVTKGYAYLEVPPESVRESLDRYARQPRPEDVIKVYRHIRGNWYLFYEYLPG